MNKLLNMFIKPVHAVDDIIGVIDVPAGIPQEVAQTSDILSAVVRFLVVIAGIFTLWQFLTGGLGIITSGGDKTKISEAQKKIEMAIVGLVIIAASFVIIAIVSQILFDDFTYILIPKFQSIK